MAILEVQNLKKAFGPTQVLDDVSFTLEEGQVLAIIGSSGGGKSTLLRCLTSLETPDSGQIRVRGRVLDGSRESRQSFGLVFQNFNLFPQYTALQNVTLAPRLAKKADAKTLQAQGMALLARVGLAEKAQNYPWQLSGGQQQRVAIARALALEPEILCFDEPTSALDPALTGEVLRVIRQLKDDGHTMILVTHEMAFAKQAADVVLYIEDGRIAEMGPPEQVFDRPRSPRTQAFLRHAQELYQEE